MKKSRLVIMLLISAVLFVFTGCQSTSTDSSGNYKLYLDLTSEDNWFFSTYDMDISLDSKPIGTVANGEEFSILLEVTGGNHDLVILKEGDSSIYCTKTINVKTDMTFSCDISHSSNSITMNNIKTKKGVEDASIEKQDSSESNEQISEDQMNEESETQKEEKSEKQSEEQSEEQKEDKPKHEYYTTNDKTAAKEGNKGVYAYVDNGPNYDVYWIIDFDEGYVYTFLDGDGNTYGDRIKIVSGDLNSVLIITYHDGGTEWSYGLHFSWKNQPDHLVVQDEDGFENDYYPTDLDEALALRDKKTITDY